MDLKELKEEIETRFYAHGKRIATFNVLFDEVNKLKKENEDLRESSRKSLELIESHKKETERQLKELKSLCDENKLSFQNQRNLISMIDETLSDVESTCEDIEADIDCLQECKTSINSNIECFKFEVDELKSIVNSISIQNKSNQNDIYLSLEKNQSLKIDNIKNTESIKKINDIVSDLDKKRSLDSQEIVSCIQGVRKIYDDFSLRLDLVKNSFYKIVQEKIKEIEIPDISNLCTKDSFNSLNKLIDSLHLDVKNSLLKSNNNEIQNTINIKQIENINLRLKNHELTSKS